MDFEKLNNKFNSELSKNLDNFTGKQELEYPTENDLADIRVINNNIKILNEKKLEAGNIEANLQGVAKETAEYSIEDTSKIILGKAISIEESIKQSIKKMGTIKSIQRGQYQGTDITRDIKISSVDTDKSMLIINGGITQYASGSSSDRFFSPYYASFKDSTTLTLTSSLGFGTSGSQGRCAWQVIEFY